MYYAAWFLHFLKVILSLDQSRCLLARVHSLVVCHSIIIKLM